MERTVPVAEGAEAFVELLNANNVDYIFLNPGTDTFPVQEALAKYKALGKRAPKVVLCLDESVAMAAAHGYFMVTGRPQVVLVHVDLGTQQVGGALHNAQRGRIGVVFCAGRAPLTYDQGLRGERDAGIHWQQEQRDQAGIVRGYVKWDYELRTIVNIHEVMQRAFQVAATEPCGPVYVSLPRELLMEKISSVTIPEVTRHAPVTTPQGDPAELAKVAKMLLDAESPLIMVGDTGRHPGAVTPLVALAESLGARVSADMVRMSFPNPHPLGGSGPVPLRDADLLLMIDRDLPYIPHHAKPRPDARIVHIGLDPIRQDLPLWVFPGDLFIQADSSKALPLLGELVRQQMTPAQRSRCQARFERIKAENESMRERQRVAAEAKARQSPITPDWVGCCLNKVIDEDTIIVHEMAMLGLVRRTKPGTLFGSGGSSLGFALGGALGAKLAAPDRTVVSLMGDGCFVFGEPIATFWAAANYHAPFLAIIYNNLQYQAPRRFLQEAYGKDSYSEKNGCWVGMDICPCPDYAKIAEACGAWGRRVDDPSELQPAMREGLARVGSGQPALLDVRLGNPYVAGS